ncbi:hypothetical protein OC834_000116 [Tilletia horrida]|nr:hypothetical protein OC834_000116 [Tilletia horrida]
MDIDEDRPPSPPAPSFVKRSKLRGSRGAARTTTSGEDGNAAVAADASSSSARIGAGARQLRGGLGFDDDDDASGTGKGSSGGADEDDGPSVIIRSNGFNSAAKRNRMKGTQSLMTSSSKAGASAASFTTRGMDSADAGSSNAPSPQAADTPAARPAFLSEPSRLSTSADMLRGAAGEDDGAEDFIPIRTRRAPVAAQTAMEEAIEPDYMEEDVIIPVYEDQEVLPDPGPIDDIDFLKGTGQQIPLHAHHHQPSRLDEPQERGNSRAKERKPTSMKEEGVLPSLTSASSRLEALLNKADSAISEFESVVLDADNNLNALDAEEKENKKVVGEAGDKEAWFRELDEFIGTIARFLDAKMPMLEAVERDNISIVAQRSRIIQKARAKDAEDELALFFGVPSTSLLPAPGGNTKEDDAGAVSSFQVDETSSEPIEDGPALSPIREARRTQAAQRPPGYDPDDLSANDRIAFQDARGEVYAQLQKITADVLAPEFLDPAATVAADEETEAGNAGAEPKARRRLHPASLVSRFGSWRSKYPDEYMGTWGGLALAGAWEFWCRREMADVDLLRPVGRLTAGGLGGSGAGLELSKFGWHRHLSEYVAGSTVGGDDEAMEAMMGNIVVPRLVALAEGGGFDPWSVKDGAAIIHLVAQLQAAVDPKGWRFQSLLTAYLAVFRTHITTFLRATSDLAPASPPAAFHPGIPAARLSFLQRLCALFRNLVAWSPFIGEAERGSFSLLVDDCVGRGVWPLLVAAKDFGSGQLAGELLQAAPEGTFTPELASRLSSFAAMPR